MSDNEDDRDDSCSDIKFIGVALTVACSWVANKSILWAIIHLIFSCFFGWTYVVYWFIAKTNFMTWLESLLI